MLFKTLLAVAGTLILGSPVLAQGWADTGGVTGQQGSGGNTTAATNGNNYYQPVAVQGQVASPVFTSSPTLKQDAASLLTSTKTLVNQGLPRTTLDSFVFQSGYNDMIYGDEGTDGPPPYDWFEVINDGIHSAGLTTNHHSDAPSAWY